MIVAAAITPAHAQPASEPPLARMPIEPIVAARLLPDERLRLDGTMQHPAWARAPEHQAFAEKDPVFGALPPQRTRVRVLFDREALWIGVRADDDRPDRIRDPLVRADQVNRTQDFVVAYVDAIGTRRSAQFFRVNAAGSMADGMHTAADDSEDFAPDFDWDAAVSRDAGGWTAVLRLPFASLRFAPGRQDWRIMVARRLPREQFHLVTSVPIPRDLPSFIHHLQPLLGVEVPADSRFLTLRPSVTARREAVGGGDARADWAASLDAKWRPLPELVVDATLRPDFSQVALDVPQLSGNSRFALFVTEKRPFFFESADLLRSPTEALYTRSFTEPRWGLRTTWRGPQWAGTALALSDRGQGLVLLPGPYGTGVAEQPASEVLAARLKGEAGPAQWGAVLAHRRYEGGRGDNTVLGPDLVWHASEHWRLRAQWLQSHTTALDSGDAGLQRGPAREGHRVLVRAVWQRGQHEGVFFLDDIGRDFRHDSGFVAQAGTRKLHAFGSLGWSGVGPFNQFHANAEFDRVIDRATGEVVSEVARPGLWATGAHNLEWWAEWYGHSRQRTARGAPLIRERYLSTGATVTPARWFPLLDGYVDIGDLADTAARQARPGVIARLNARLRPLPRLELEPSLSAARLRRDGRTTYEESAMQWLAVWHFNARHSLRLIADHTRLDRQAELATATRPAVAEQRERTQAVSLTYAWRESAGTVLYLGASRNRAGTGLPHDTEVFAKLQVDVGEVSRAWPRGRGVPGSGEMRLGTRAPSTGVETMGRRERDLP